MSPEWPVVQLACAMTGPRCTDTIHMKLHLFCLPNLPIRLRLTTMSPDDQNNSLFSDMMGLKFYWYNAYHIGPFCLPSLLIKSNYTLFSVIHFTIPARTYLSLSCSVLGTACFFSFANTQESCVLVY